MDIFKTLEKIGCDIRRAEGTDFAMSTGTSPSGKLVQVWESWTNSREWGRYGLTVEVRIGGSVRHDLDKLAAELTDPTFVNDDNGTDDNGLPF